MCLKTFQELVGFMKETEKDWQGRVGCLTRFFEFLEPRLKVKISVMPFGNLQLSLESESGPFIFESLLSMIHTTSPDLPVLALKKKRTAQLVLDILKSD
jgi:hypothetical protein